MNDLEKPRTAGEIAFLDYASQILTDLSKNARSKNLPTLSYFIEMAAYEAMTLKTQSKDDH